MLLTLLLGFALVADSQSSLPDEPVVCPRWDVPSVENIDYVRGMLREMIESNPKIPGDSHITAALTQLVFHDCVGGCDGCLRADISANNLLLQKGGAVDILEEVYQKIPFRDQNVESGGPPFISRADFWVLAGITAVEEATKVCYGGGGDTGYVLPEMTFTWGRKDCPTSPRARDDKIELPSASKGMADIHRVFRDIMKMDDSEFTALLGAHTLGHSHFTEVLTFRQGRTVSQQCGYYRTCQRTVFTTISRIHHFNGPWTPNPNCFDNSYYRGLLDNKYGSQAQINGLGASDAACLKGQSCFEQSPVTSPQTNTQAYIMLPSDLVLAEGSTDSKGGKSLPRQAVERFAASELTWKQEFGKAFDKMTMFPRRLHTPGCTPAPTQSGETFAPTNKYSSSPTVAPTAPTPLPPSLPPTNTASPTVPGEQVTEVLVSSDVLKSDNHGVVEERQSFATPSPSHVTFGPTYAGQKVFTRAPSPPTTSPSTSPTAAPVTRSPTNPPVTRSPTPQPTATSSPTLKITKTDSPTPQQPDTTATKAPSSAAEGPMATKSPSAAGEGSMATKSPSAAGPKDGSSATKAPSTAAGDGSASTKAPSAAAGDDAPGVSSLAPVSRPWQLVGVGTAAVSFLLALL